MDTHEPGASGRNTARRRPLRFAIVLVFAIIAAAVFATSAIAAPVAPVISGPTDLKFIQHPLGFRGAIGWASVPTATAYRVYDADSSALISTVTTPTYMVYGLQNTTYRRYVVAVDSIGGASPPSNTLSIRTVAPVAPAAPAGFDSLPSSVFDLRTSSPPSGMVPVAAQYDPDELTVDPSELKLLHYSNGAWVDISTAVDVENDLVLGSTDSFSVFAVVQPNGSEPAASGMEGTITSGALPLNRVVVTAFDASTDAYVKGVFTDVLGRYTLALPSGAYHLRFTGVTPSTLTQFFDHQTSISRASLVTVGMGEMKTVSSDLAAISPPTVQVFTGTITNGGVPQNRAVVSAFNAASDAYVKGAFTDVAGQYTLSLPSGSYHLRFTGTTPAALSQYYDHVASIGSAAVVSLAEGETKTVSSDLAPTSPPSTQALTGTITDGSTPLNRVVVTAFDASSHAYVKGVFTDALGRYAMSLPAGSFHLRVTGTTPSTLSQFYDHEARISAASVVVLDPGADTAVSSDLSGIIAP